MFERIDMSALEQELIALRREFHRYPETGWTELRTSVRIIEELEKEGIPVAYGPAIHVAEKRYAVPPEDVLERHRLRALEETERAELVNAMAGGFTGCVACIEGALPGPPWASGWTSTATICRRAAIPPTGLRRKDSHPSMTDACTPADMTPTPPSASARRSCCGHTGISCGAK